LVLKVVFFTFYYPPDLSAGSFRSVALAEALSSKMKEGDEIHAITTHPNRYSNYCVEADSLEVTGKITVHRIGVPVHKSGMLLQARSFVVYAVSAYRLCRKIAPDFLIGTTGRLMTGVLTGLVAFRLGKSYFIDLRDIFSEAISDLFARKSILLGYMAKKIFSLLDVHLLVRAAGVNVVSEGFNDYFVKNGVDTNKWSFFPNGVDQEFIEFDPVIGGTTSGVKTILYAGNIGSGQGLDDIVPRLAKKLESNFKFLIIGSGGTVNLLKKVINKCEVNNVELVDPVGHPELMEYYAQADMLFLHLNDVPAFSRVLPSKIFEYAALGKPIVAGVKGYSAKFLDENVSYASIFDPGDYESAALLISKSIDVKVPAEEVSDFLNRYSRHKIMNEFAEHILLTIRKENTR